MKKFLFLGTFCALLAAAPLASHAATLNGSDSVAFGSVTVTPGGSSLNPISGITSINWATALTFSNGAGDLSSIPFGTGITGSSSLYPGGVDAGNGTPFTLTFGSYGTFTSTQNARIIANTTTGTSSAVEIYLLGTFTPGASFPGYDSNSASLDITFNKTGGSYSGSGTFSTPAAPLSPVPEPSSLILLGTGLLGGVGVLRRRMAA